MEPDEILVSSLPVFHFFPPVVIWLIWRVECHQTPEFPWASRKFHVKMIRRAHQMCPGIFPVVQVWDWGTIRTTWLFSKKILWVSRMVRDNVDKIECLIVFRVECEIIVWSGQIVVNACAMLTWPVSETSLAQVLLPRFITVLRLDNALSINVIKLKRILPSLTWCFSWYKLPRSHFIESEQSFLSFPW